MYHFSNLRTSLMISNRKQATKTFRIWLLIVGFIDRSKSQSLGVYFEPLGIDFRLLGVTFFDLGDYMLSIWESIFDLWKFFCLWVSRLGKLVLILFLWG